MTRSARGSGNEWSGHTEGWSPDTTQAATFVAGMLLTGFGQTVPGYGPPPGYGPAIPGYGPDNVGARPATGISADAAGLRLAAAGPVDGRG